MQEIGLPLPFQESYDSIKFKDHETQIKPVYSNALVEILSSEDD